MNGTGTAEDPDRYISESTRLGDTMVLPVQNRGQAPSPSKPGRRPRARSPKPDSAAPPKPDAGRRIGLAIGVLVFGAALAAILILALA